MRQTADARDGVNVVGAGLAGLTAAVTLADHGIAVTVLEGADRIGGRIGTTAGCDLGPTWVWPPWQPVVATWLDHLGLNTFPQYDAGDGLLDGYGGPVRRHPLPGQDGIARIVGGPAALTDALAARLPDGAIRLGQTVTAVTQDAGGLVVTAGDHRIAAAHVILAVPPRLALDRLAPPDAALEAALRATPTWMARQAKVAATWSRPFWRDAGLSGRVASRTGPLVEVHDHSPPTGGRGALFGFCGWDAATRAADPDGLRRAILAQLMRCFGPEAGAPDDLIVMDWAQQPLICSEADRLELPQHPKVGPDILRQPHLNGRLWFAGAETAADHPGLIAGALLAGQTTAQRIIAEMSASRPEGRDARSLTSRRNDRGP